MTTDPPEVEPKALPSLPEIEAKVLRAFRALLKTALRSHGFEAVSYRPVPGGIEAVFRYLKRSPRSNRAEQKVVIANCYTREQKENPE